MASSTRCASFSKATDGRDSVIRTERLLLRRARADDLDGVHALLSDAAAMRYWSTLPHNDIEQTREWLNGMIAASPDVSDDFVVEHKGRVIGKAGCWQVPEIGFIFHPTVWGQGFAREALTALIAHVFATRPIEAITADVDPRNLPSLSLLGKLGFIETHRAERTFQAGDEWFDSVYLERPRPAA